MEENTQVVNEEVTTPESTEEDTQAGEKTDPNLLLKSLKEEREKRRLAEEASRDSLNRIRELEELQDKSSALSDEVYSDEGKALREELKSLKSELSGVKGELTKRDLQTSNQVFRDKWEEFEEFRSSSDNKGMNLRTAAKAFLIEQGLYEPSRKGLEKPTGGNKTPMPSGMTAEDVSTLRKTNFKKYQELLMSGKLKINR